VVEFHVSGKRKADAYAMLWLHHLIDNEDTPISVPIWTTSHPARLTQNYITPENFQKEVGLEDMKEVGRLEFRGRFKPGMDESHEAFISDNDSRETFETWEACLAEGVRDRHVTQTTPELLQELHDASLTEGRDVLKNADDKEKKKWLSKSGTDWSGAFGHDPAAYMLKGKKAREPGAEEPIHRDPTHPSDDDHPSAEEQDSSEVSSTEFVVQEGSSMNDGGAIQAVQSNSMGTKPSTDSSRTNGSSSTSSSSSSHVNKQLKHTETRKHRGMMQWKPARNAKFAKDEGMIAIRKVANKLKGDLNGRSPGVETEIGQ
jgi:hypothetical protein